MADQHVQEFEQAALVYVDELFRTARRLSGGDTPAAEDLLQETLLRAWRSFHRFTPGTNCRAWLHKILLHVRAQRARRERHRTVVEQSSFSPAGATSSTAAVTTADHIRRAFSELPAHYQAVILLADVADFSYREIAAALNVPVGTVMSLPASLPRPIAGALRQHELCALRGAAPLADPAEAARVSSALPRVDFRRAGLHPVSGHVCRGPAGHYADVVFAGEGRTASVLLETASHGADPAHGTFTAGGFAVAVARGGDRGGYIVTTVDAAGSAAAGVRSLNAFFKEMQW